VRLLLDTCTFIWITQGGNELSEPAAEAFADSANEVFLSAASVWEITIKVALRQLVFVEPPDRLVPAYRASHGIRPLPLDEESAFQVAKLPRIHKDPFDRMLICQALVGGMHIVTPDPNIRKYPILTLW
jgi:PIN domain nuclease of toxin-antitoxin system